MLSFYKRVLDRIGAVEQGLGVALILLMVVAITVQVFTRYALGRPIAWVEESATYAFIWVVFVGASLGLKRGRHIVIATFGSHLPPHIAGAMRMLVWMLVLIMLVVMIVQGMKVMGIEGRSTTISLPLTISAASMTLTAIYLVLQELPVLAGRPAPAAPQVVSL